MPHENTVILLRIVENLQTFTVPERLHERPMNVFDR
jgi:hypothetical protein